MQSIAIGDNRFSYDMAGDKMAGDEMAGDKPVLLLLSGWCQDHRLFKHLAPELAKTHTVVRFDWRGHGEDRRYDGDFDTAKQAADVAAFLDRVGIETLVPISTSHGGWATMALLDRLGATRIPKAVVIDWIQVRPNDAFFAALDRIQDETQWRQGCRDLFDYWIGETGNRDIIDHVNQEMAAFDFAMWARSCREIAAAYAAWGYPMRRMAGLAEPRAITHIYSQPFEQAYAQAQSDFAADHPWFKPVKLPGKTHFPTLEQPLAVAEAIRRFLG